MFYTSYFYKLEITTLSRLSLFLLSHSVFLICLLFAFVSFFIFFILIASFILLYTCLQFQIIVFLVSLIYFSYFFTLFAYFSSYWCLYFFITFLRISIYQLASRFILDGVTHCNHGDGLVSAFNPPT